MKIHCPSCEAGYKIDEAKIPAKGAYTRCKKCQTRFLVKPKPASEGTEKPAGVEMPQPADPIVNPPPAPPATPEPSEDASKSKEANSGDLKQVDQYVAEGNSEAAAALLLDLISRHAREKDFAAAEALRDKLYDAAPMALTQIVKANEIIEEEKTNSIDPKQLELWSALFDTLESDETSELYYAMQSCTVASDQPLFEKGERNSNLYFIQEGRLKMTHWDHTTERETILKEFFPGEIVNQDSFFSFTVTTATVVATQDSVLTYLEQSILDKWREKFPGIEPKLSSFCRESVNVKELAKRAGIELRAHQRFVTSLKARIQLLDSSGNPLKNPFKVSLFDISAGGVSFGLKLNRREEAAQLVGQPVTAQTAYKSANTTQQVHQNGKIVAAHLQPYGESTIHIQFDSPLPDETMKEIEKVSSQSGDET